MGFKEKLQKKIEKNAIKSFLSWKDPKGNVHEEVVYLKRSQTPLIGDWMRIYPPLNEDGSTNWLNLIFGGRKNLIKLLMVLGIVFIIGLAFKELFNYIAILQDDFCYKTCIETVFNVVGN